MNRMQGIGLFVLIAGGALFLALRSPPPVPMPPQTSESSPLSPETATPPPAESAAAPVASSPPPVTLDASRAMTALVIDAGPEAAPPNQFDMKAAVTQQACFNARNMERARNWEHSAPIKKIFEEEKARCLAGGGHW
jgi:hypothetical protein